MSYTGTELTLFAEVDGAFGAISTTSWANQDMPSRSNTQPLRIGQGFLGLIDDVRMYDSGAVSAENMFGDSFCPLKDSEDKLVAHYRFNEGNNYGVRDAKGKAHGIVGLVSSQVAEKSEMKLNCPAGSHITNILYANFGVTGGTAGAYYVDGCSASTSMKEVTKECLGKQSCRMHAVVRNFGQPCKNSVKTLAVTATCGMAGEPFWSNMTAPTLVGVADAAVQPTCAFGSAWNTTYPAEFSDMLANKTCDGFDLSEATVGEIVTFGIVKKDGCGYSDYTPEEKELYKGTFSYGFEVYGTSPSGPSEGCFAMGMDMISVDVMSNHAGGYCGTFNDAHVFTYTPAHCRRARCTRAPSNGADKKFRAIPWSTVAAKRLIRERTEQQEADRRKRYELNYDAVSMLNLCDEPDNARAKAYTRIASALFAIGKFREAYDAFGSALQIDPSNEVCLHGREECAARLPVPTSGDNLVVTASDRYAKDAPVTPARWEESGVAPRKPLTLKQVLELAAEAGFWMDASASDPSDTRPLRGAC